MVRDGGWRERKLKKGDFWSQYVRRKNRVEQRISHSSSYGNGGPDWFLTVGKSCIASGSLDNCLMIADLC